MSQTHLCCLAQGRWQLCSPQLKWGCRRQVLQLLCWLSELAQLLQHGSLLEALAQWLVLPGPTNETGAEPVWVAPQVRLQLQGQAAPLEHAVQLV